LAPAECFQNLSRLLPGEARAHDRRLVAPNPGSRKWEYAGHRLPAKAARIRIAGEVVGQRFCHLPAHDLFDGETMVAGIVYSTRSLPFLTGSPLPGRRHPFYTVNER